MRAARIVLGTVLAIAPLACAFDRHGSGEADAVAGVAGVAGAGGSSAGMAGSAGIAGSGGEAAGAAGAGGESGAGGEGVGKAGEAGAAGKSGSAGEAGSGGKSGGGGKTGAAGSSGASGCAGNATMSCYTGPPNTSGVGVCHDGYTPCGQPFQCMTEQVPSPETCNGLDDDCNGKVDDGDPGGNAPCTTTMLGPCMPGVTHCEQGKVICVANVKPSMEVCNGKDDDCNGMVDDGDPGGGMPCDTKLLGECAAGTTHCVNAAITCTPNATPTPETCNGKDDDCNGKVDDGDPGGNMPCATGQQGNCNNGTTHCQSGVVACVAPAPMAEGCSLQDLNCNGICDDGGGCRIPIYRFVNGNGQHYFSANAAPAPGYTNEGVAFYNYGVAGPGLALLYQCAADSSGGFFLDWDPGCGGPPNTLNQDEGYAAGESFCGDVPIYLVSRSMPNVDYVYTQYLAEAAAWIAGGYTWAGPVFYAWSVP